MVLTVADLAGVVYSAGKVFDGLRTGRLDTEKFLQSGSLDGVTSKSDLMLLLDLRDTAQFVVDNLGCPVDAGYLVALNKRIARSGSITPGVLRRDEHRIGISTRYGRHEPPALTTNQLQALCDAALGTEHPLDGAAELFVRVAAAQPFLDGNKRTALFGANGVTLSLDPPVLLTVPYDESDPSISDQFNDALARAYLTGDTSTAVCLLLAYAAPLKLGRIARLKVASSLPDAGRGFPAA